MRALGKGLGYGKGYGVNAGNLHTILAQPVQGDILHTMLFPCTQSFGISLQTLRSGNLHTIHAQPVQGGNLHTMLLYCPDA